MEPKGGENEDFRGIRTAIAGFLQCDRDSDIEAARTEQQIVFNETLQVSPETPIERTWTGDGHMRLDP
jgi:hypothetical protein